MPATAGAGREPAPRSRTGSAPVIGVANAMAPRPLTPCGPSRSRGPGRGPAQGRGWSAPAGAVRPGVPVQPRYRWLPAAAAPCALRPCRSGSLGRLAAPRRRVVLLAGAQRRLPNRLPPIFSRSPRSTLPPSWSSTAPSSRSRPPCCRTCCCPAQQRPQCLRAGRGLATLEHLPGEETHHQRCQHLHQLAGLVGTQAGGLAQAGGGRGLPVARIWPRMPAPSVCRLGWP